MPEETFNLKKIYAAYLDCRKKKQNKKAHNVFFFDLEKHLTELVKKLKNREYAMGRFFCFVETYPTMREIFASSFHDRVVHHFLTRELEPFFEPVFIANSFACRKGKGVHSAVSQLQKGLQSLQDKSKEKIFYAKLDISSFFMSIDKNILFALIEKRLRKKYLKMKKSQKWLEDILWLLRVIIFTDPTNNCIKLGKFSLFQEVLPRKSLFHTAKHKGLPIGNLTSQFFANIYLNELDQFVKRSLKIKHYYRYVDDFILLGKNGKNLFGLANELDDFLEKKLGLNLNRKKTVIQKAEKGIDFLGYIVRQKYLLVRRKVIGNFRKKIKQCLKKTPEKDFCDIMRINELIVSYGGFLGKAKSYLLLGSLLKFLAGHAYCIYKS
jgi:RNA-directed DNA polymerase